MKRRYRILVTAVGLTSTRAVQTDDLFDAMTQAHKWQEEGVHEILISLRDVEAVAAYRRAFDIPAPEQEA